MTQSAHSPIPSVQRDPFHPMDRAAAGVTASPPVRAPDPPAGAGAAVVPDAPDGPPAWAGPLLQAAACAGLCGFIVATGVAGPTAPVVLAAALAGAGGLALSVVQIRAGRRRLSLERLRRQRVARDLQRRTQQLQTAQRPAAEPRGANRVSVGALPDPRPLNVLPEHRDTMTDVPNRLWFEQFVRRLGAEPDSQRCEIVLVELQQVAQTVTAHGLHAGELLLRSVAQRLRSDLRNSDRIARVGNVTFALALETRVGGDQAVDIARRLVMRACKPIVLPDGAVVTPTATHKLVTTRDATHLPDDAQSVTDRTVVRAQRSARGDIDQ